MSDTRTVTRGDIEAALHVWRGHAGPVPHPLICGRDADAIFAALPPSSDSGLRADSQYRALVASITTEAAATPGRSISKRRLLAFIDAAAALAASSDLAEHTHRRLWCERNESSASAHGHTDSCYRDEPCHLTLPHGSWAGWGWIVCGKPGHPDNEHWCRPVAAIVRSLWDAVKALDALWDEPDPDDEDFKDGLIWMRDECEMAGALRALRTALIGSQP